MPAGPYNQYSPNFEIGEMDFCFFACVFGCGLQSLGLLWLYLGTLIFIRGSVFYKVLGRRIFRDMQPKHFPNIGDGASPTTNLPQSLTRNSSPISGQGSFPNFCFLPPRFSPNFPPSVPPIFPQFFSPIFLFDFGVF